MIQAETVAHTAPSASLYIRHILQPCMSYSGRDQCWAIHRPLWAAPSFTLPHSSYIPGAALPSAEASTQPNPRGVQEHRLGGVWEGEHTSSGLRKSTLITNSHAAARCFPAKIQHYVPHVHVWNSHMQYM